MLERQTRTPQFLAMNPVGQIPVVELDTNKYLAQSNAILRYIAKGSDLIPKDSFQEAKMDEWLFWEQYSLEPAIAVLRFKRFFQKLDDSKIDPELIAKSRSALKIMDEHLSKTPYFVGQDFSIADISLLAYTRLAPEAGLDLTPFRSVQSWIFECQKKLKI